MRAIILISILLITLQSPHAQEISNQKLRDITLAVREICAAPDRQGEGWTLDISGSGEASFRIAGVEGEAKFSREEWNGIKDSIEDRQDLRACARDLTPLIIERFAGAPTKKMSSNGSAPPGRPKNLTFRMTGGATEFLTSDEILLSMTGTPCRGRGDLVCISLAGANYSLALGQQIDVVSSGGSCQLALIDIFKGENAARFNLRCPSQNVLSDNQSSGTPNGNKSQVFRMAGGTTEFITADEILLSMVKTPCGARGDLVCVNVAGVDHFLSLGEQLDVVTSDGRCQLTLTEILKGQDAARFHLRC